MKAKFIAVVSFLALLSVPAFAQTRGKPKPPKATQTRPAVSAGAPSTKPARSQPKPVAMTEPTAEPVNMTVEQANENQLRQLEAKNEETLRRDGAEATYHRMNRSSMTVLPVIIQVPGLGQTDDKGKPIYTRSELFRRRQILPLAGDMLVSTKHHYNTVRLDMQSVFMKLLQDSANFYALTNLPPPKVGLFTTGTRKEQTKSKPASAKPVSAAQTSLKKELKQGMGDYFSGKKFTAEEGQLEASLRESLVRGNVGTSILKVWTNKPILMERIMMTQKEADRVERVDVKKMDVWQNMLRKNYVVVLALINPHKDVDYENKNAYGKPTETYRSDVEAFLFQVDTVGLDINNIHNRHNLRFVTRLSAGVIDCDPRNEEFSEMLGGGVSIEQMQEKVKQLVANDLRHQADLFYQAKSYECAKNYYTYVLSTRPTDSADIQKIIDKCSAQIGRSSRASTDSTCLASETSLFEEWVYGQGASNTIIQDFERHVGDLKVLSYVVKTEPMIAAEIGRKEGVYVDQRFLVYRKTIDKAGVVGKQRIGTLRAIRVSANTSRFDQFKSTSKSPFSSIQMAGAIPDMFRTLRADARSDTSQRTVARSQTTKPSAPTRQSIADSIMQHDLTTMTLFKQVDGGHIEPFDLIEQNDDYGVGLLVGYGLKLGVAAFTVGGDVRLGRILPGFLPVAGVRLGFNASFLDKQRAQAEWKVAKDKTTALELYLARELYLSPRFDLKPLAGVSAFNSTYNLMFGTAALINISGRNSNTKVKLAPDVSYVLGYTYQANVNLKLDF